MPEQNLSENTEFLTGDGKPFVKETLYHFFDQTWSREIISVVFHNEPDQSGGVRIFQERIPVRRLREKINDAINDGKEYFQNFVERNQNEILKLENLRVEDKTDD